MLISFSAFRFRSGGGSVFFGRSHHCRARKLFAPAVGLVVGLTLGLSDLPVATAHTVPLVPTESKQSSDNAQLRERVEQWWTARKNGDHRKMYELYSPQLREQRPYETFVAESVARARIPLSGFDLVTFEAAGPDRALATLKLHLVVPAGKVTTDVEEDWIIADGQWFKVYKPPVIPSPPPGMQGKIVIPDSTRGQAAPPK